MLVVHDTLEAEHYTPRVTVPILAGALASLEAAQYMLAAWHEAYVNVLRQALNRTRVPREGDIDA